MDARDDMYRADWDNHCSGSNHESAVLQMTVDLSLNIADK